MDSVLPSLLSLTDSHCHVRASSDAPVPVPVPSSSPSPSPSPSACAVPCAIHRAVVCGTHPAVDWALVEAAAAAGGPVRVVPGFGVHPWLAPSRGGAAELLAQLEDALCRFPHAVVGEIGLDKLRGPPEEEQMEMFTAQLRLAARYGRPVSVHCVRSQGAMLKALQDLDAESTPPAFVMHGFTGSLEFAKSVMKIRKKRPLTAPGSRVVLKAEPLNVFFGVCAATSLRVKGFVERTLPFLLDEGRALLETDAHHTLSPDNPNDTTQRMLWDATQLGQLLTFTRNIESAGSVADNGKTWETSDEIVRCCEEAFARAFATVLQDPRIVH